MGHKAAKTTHSLTWNLAQELLTTIQCNSGPRSFAVETSALKMRRAVAGHCKLTMTN